MTETPDSAWIQTFTGKKFYPFNPKPEDIDIRDIAHALSNICRFTGHVKRFYSVADHCRNVAKLVPAHMKLQALLHDASEAYLCDLARPVKQHAGMDFYVIAERVLQRAIYLRFGIPYGVPYKEPDELKAADARMCGAEALALMGPLTEPERWKWATDLVDGSEPLEICSPFWSEQTFWSEFQNYGGKV